MAELRRQLAARDDELAELGDCLGGLERENSNLEAQVGGGQRGWECDMRGGCGAHLPAEALCNLPGSAARGSHPCLPAVSSKNTLA